MRQPGVTLWSALVRRFGKQPRPIKIGESDGRINHGIRSLLRHFEVDLDLKDGSIFSGLLLGETVAKVSTSNAVSPSLQGYVRQDRSPDIKLGVVWHPAFAASAGARELTEWRWCAGASMPTRVVLSHCRKTNTN